MSASQSNLSDPKYGYDLVVAITQASVNVTMEQFLASVSTPEVIVCYIYDANNNLVPIDYNTLKTNAKGSDPFSVADGAGAATNQDLINLTNANFAGGVKAQIGLPSVPLANIPPIVTLSNGTDAPVLFNLLCSEFQIAGFDYGPRGKATWINQAELSNGSVTPWYFSANVKLESTAVDPKSPVPPAVKQRMQDLIHSVGANAFSIQQLFLELDTAILDSVPAIGGVPAGWSVWQLISKVFLQEYFAQLQKKGKPVLGYAVALTNPTPATLQLGSISHECCGFLNNGQPIGNPTAAQRDAATFVYLGTMAKKPPTPVEFPWNWIELGDVTNFAGVQAVRRDIFLSFLARLLNNEIGPLCQETSVSLTHSGDNYGVLYSSRNSNQPAFFQLTKPVALPPALAFLKLPALASSVLSLSFTHNSHDDSEAADHLSTIHGDFNYSLLGSVLVHGNQISIAMTAQAYMKFNHGELGINYDDLPGNTYYNKTLLVTYTMSVSQNGQLVVTQSNKVTDNSAPWAFKAGGILGITGFESNVQTGLQKIDTTLSGYLDRAFSSYASEVTSEINGYKGWVFPGSSSFVFNNVSFSSGQDLITELTYASFN